MQITTWNKLFNLINVLINCRCNFVRRINHLDERAAFRFEASCAITDTACFVSSGSQADTRSLNAITRESDCLKNENPGNLRRNARLPAAAPAEIECRSLGTSLTEKCMTPTSLSGTKCNSCRGISFAGTVRKCKSFLAELRCNDGRLRVSKCSPKTSGACSLKQVSARLTPCN